MASIAVVTVENDPYGGLVSVLAAILFVLPLLGLLGTVFLWRVYRSDTHRPRSWVLLLLAGGATIVEMASLVVAWLALRRLLGAESLPEGAVLLAVAVLALESIPIWYAYTIWRRRKVGRNDPPFEHHDESVG